MHVHVQTEPRPTPRFSSDRHLVLAADERPNLVALEPLARQVPERLILVARAGRAEIDQQLHDGVLCNASHANRSPDAVAFDQCRDDAHPVRCAQPVHIDHYA